MDNGKLNGSFSGKENPHDIFVSRKEFKPFAQKVDELVINDAKDSVRVGTIEKNIEKMADYSEKMSDNIIKLNETMIKLVEREAYHEKIKLLIVKIATYTIIPGVGMIIAHFVGLIKILNKWVT